MGLETYLKLSEERADEDEETVVINGNLQEDRKECVDDEERIVSVAYITAV